MKVSGAPAVFVIIPALNEAQSIDKVIRAIPPLSKLRVIVADNGSTDDTALIAAQAGALVVSAPERGYGSACLAALRDLSGDRSAIPQSEAAGQRSRAMAAMPDTASGNDIIVFLDGDFSDDPAELPLLLEPLLTDSADLVIGSRVRRAARGSLTFAQRSGNRLAVTLIRLIWRHRYTDLGPFRAIRYNALQRLNMQDRTFGWTVEMQVRALKQGLRVTEADVSYRPRIGQSKISGTISGTIRAGAKILSTIAREALSTTEI